METKATLNLDGKEYEMPIITGTEQEKAFDITKLRDQTGYITYDPGFGNTGACSSAITFIDGEKGILRYRGIPIEELAQKADFIEAAMLLIWGKLPQPAERQKFSDQLSRNALLHENFRYHFEGFPWNSHPMAILSAMVSALSCYYPKLALPSTPDEFEESTAQLISKIRTIVAYTFKMVRGEPFIYPDPKRRYVSNLLYMMFSLPNEPYEVLPEVAGALDLFLLLHADHEQNCSTSTVRMVASSGANLFASISAGISALWGPIHGGANQAVIEMLQGIHKGGHSIKEVVAMAKDKNSGFRLMGFGHRIYKSYDPRATIIKAVCDRLLDRLGVQDPLLDIARELEQAALSDPYFIERKLYPNVDFYSGIILRAIGIPTKMFTVFFAMGRLPGWIAQWKELTDDATPRIARPRQIYTGPPLQPYLPLEQR